MIRRTTLTITTRPGALLGRRPQLWLCGDVGVTPISGRISTINKTLPKPTGFSWRQLGNATQLVGAEAAGGVTITVVPVPVPGVAGSPLLPSYAGAPGLPWLPVASGGPAGPGTATGAGGVLTTTGRSQAASANAASSAAISIERFMMDPWMNWIGAQLAAPPWCAEPRRSPLPSAPHSCLRRAVQCADEQRKLRRTARRQRRPGGHDPAQKVLHVTPGATAAGRSGSAGGAYDLCLNRRIDKPGQASVSASTILT